MTARLPRLFGLLLLCSACGAKTPPATARASGGEEEEPPGKELALPELPEEPAVPLTADYQAAEARARTFAQSFVWTAEPSIDSAPSTGSYGAVGDTPFAIDHVEVWVKEREFSVRAVYGGMIRALGPEIIVPGKLEKKLYRGAMGESRGYFQAPIGGKKRPASFVDTTSVSGPNAYVVEIREIHYEDGVPQRVSLRFVSVYDGRRGAPRMWAAGSSHDAVVQSFRK